jgi:predicted NBD/HSP70 family sugar kinase
MTNCCGKPHSSRFCPDCGRQLCAAGSLFGLLSHCRKMEKVQGGRAKTYARQEEETQAHGAKVSAEKWKAWGDALAALLDEPAAI